MIRLFVRRVLKNKIYWLAVFSALVLLLCSVVYTDPATGEDFIFLSVLYNEEMQKYLQNGVISLREIWMGYQIHNYLGMFAPIIAGIPCILNQRTERFVLFRGSKSGYFISKYIANFMLSGGIFVLAQMLFLLAGGGILQWIAILKQIAISPVSFWDNYMLQHIWTLFCEGVLDAIPGILLAEFVRNKYWILCVPFVWKYLMDMFVMGWIPFEIQQYMLPKQNPIVFIGILVVCGVFIRGVAERRCDCGQR